MHGKSVGGGLATEGTRGHHITIAFGRQYKSVHKGGTKTTYCHETRRALGIGKNHNFTTRLHIKPTIFSPAYGMKASWASAFVMLLMGIPMRMFAFRRGPVTKRRTLLHRLATKKRKREAKGNVGFVSRRCEKTTSGAGGHAYERRSWGSLLDGT